MSPKALSATLDKWNINAAQAAKILCLHTSKISEYLSGTARIPCSFSFTLELLALLDDEKRKQVFEKRINREPHSG